MPALRVLVVDDEPINRLVLQGFLQDTAVALTLASTGAEAVEAFKSAGFDVILMDVQMPVMDGLTAIRAIRQHELANGQARGRIHVLSAYGLAEDIAASREAGADSHLTKPARLAEVIAAVFGTGGAQVRLRPGHRA